MQERPKKRLLHVWVATGDSWSGQSAGNAKNKLLLVLGCDREFLVATEFFSGSVSRHGSQILSNKSCHNMDFFVTIGVLVLCRDDVATEVSLSRSRRRRQEVRCHDRAWPWARNFMS